MPTWGKRPSDAGYMHRLALTGDSHGRQLGQKIIDWAMGEVERHGRRFLRLDCRVANKGLCDYYEAAGFTRVGETGAKAILERRL